MELSASAWRYKLKVRDVIKQLEADGWVFARRGGRASHQIYKKKDVVSEIAISGAASDDVSPGQL